MNAFVHGFLSELEKIAATTEVRGPIQKIKDVAASKPLWGLTEVSRSPVLKAGKKAAKGLYKRLTEGGPESQAMLARVRKASIEGR